MSNFNRTLIYSVFALSILFSCKKDSNNNPPAAVTIAFEKNDYVSFEVASLVSSETMNSTTYSATIDGTVGVTLDRTDSILVFIMPVLSTGAHTLKVDLGNGEQTLNFNIVQGNVIADPDQYFQNYASVYDFRMLNNFSKGDTLLTGIDRSNFLADQQTISNNATLAIQNFSNLSLAEKNQVVQFLDANKAWMDELQASINDLKTIMGQLRVNVVDDYDLRVTEAMINFQKVKRDIIINNKKIIALVGASCLFLSPVGCAIAVGVGLGYFISEIQDLNLTIDELMDVIYYPFYNLLGQRPLNVIFENGVPKDLIVTMDYRTIYNGDGNSSVPLVQNIVGALLVIKQEWNLLLSELPFSLSFGPKDLNSISNYNTSNKRIHSRYLSLSNISSSQIIVDENYTDGYFYLIFSNLNLTSNQNFSFDINYINANMGNHTYTVNAELIPLSNCQNTTGTFTDPRDGYVYQTVTIGSQTWFAENLRYSGSITQIVDSIQWSNNGTNPAWMYFEHNPANNATWGKLYNWYAVSTGNLCPSGWHIPSDAEWTQLTNYLGGENVAGGKMKSTTGWRSPNVDATNESCFSGLPGGGLCEGYIFCNWNGGSNGIAYWWSTTENLAGTAWGRTLFVEYGFLSRGDPRKLLHLSCRCVQD